MPSPALVRCWHWPGPSFRTIVRTRRSPRASRSGTPRMPRASWPRPNSIAAPSRTWPSRVRDGTIGMISPGLVPIRRQGDGRLPVPGWTGAFDWVGMIPADRTAARGRSAERSPGQRQQSPGRRGLSPPAHGRMGGRPCGPSGSKRCWPNRARLDPDRFAGIQLDVMSGLAADFLPFLPAPESVAPASRRGARRAGRLGRPGPRGPSRAAHVRRLVPGTRQRHRRGRAGSCLGGIPQSSPVSRAACCHEAKAGATSRQAVASEVAARAFETALAALSARYGADWRSWRWGDAHPALLAHRPFEQVPLLRDWFSRLVPAVGATAARSTWRAPAWVARATLPFAACSCGGLSRDLRPRGARSVALGGGDRPVRSPAFPLYVDQAQLWREGRYLTMSMAVPDAAAATVGTLRLHPMAGP